MTHEDQILKATTDQLLNLLNAGEPEPVCPNCAILLDSDRGRWFCWECGYFTRGDSAPVDLNPAEPLPHDHTAFDVAAMDEPQ